MLPDWVDGLTWHTADGFCSPGGSFCTLGCVVERAAVPALPWVSVAIFSCRVVVPAGFAAGGLVYSSVHCPGGLIGP